MFKQYQVWDKYNNNNNSPPMIAFWGASRRQIWTKIGGNESQDLPICPRILSFEQNTCKLTRKVLRQISEKYEFRL